MVILRKCLRDIRTIHRISQIFGVHSFSGRFDGSVDAQAPSRVGFEEIKHNSKQILNNEQFLVSDANEKGFVVNNSFVVGPLLLLPYMGFLHWKCDNINGATCDSVFLISRILPKVRL